VGSGASPRPPKRFPAFYRRQMAFPGMSRGLNALMSHCIIFHSREIFFHHFDWGVEPVNLPLNTALSLTALPPAFPPHGLQSGLPHGCGSCSPAAKRISVQNFRIRCSYSQLIWQQKPKPSFHFWRGQCYWHPNQPEHGERCLPVPNGL